MRRYVAIVLLACAASGFVTPASACGTDNTVALLKALNTMDKPPAFRCGSEFNVMLERAHKRNWKGALSAYEAHLSGMGKWQAGTPDSKATLAYLRRMAQAK